MDKNDSPIENCPWMFMQNLGFSFVASGIVLTGLFSWIYEYIQSVVSGKW